MGLNPTADEREYLQPGDLSQGVSAMAVVMAEAPRFSGDNKGFFIRTDRLMVRPNPVDGNDLIGAPRDDARQPT